MGEDNQSDICCKCWKAALLQLVSKNKNHINIVCK